MGDQALGGARRRVIAISVIGVATIALTVGSLLVWRTASAGDESIAVEQVPVVATSPSSPTSTTSSTEPATTTTAGAEAAPAALPTTDARPPAAGVPPSSRPPTGGAAPTTGPLAPGPGPAAPAPVVVATPSPPRVAVIGDSTAERLAPAVASWGAATNRLLGVGNGARMGCPMGRGGQAHTTADIVGAVNPVCDWATASAPGFDGTTRPSYPNLVAGWRPDLVVVDSGMWDISDRMLPGDDVWRGLGDPVLDAWLLDEMTSATDLLASGGARVVWLTQAPWEGAVRNPPPKVFAPAADPARMRRYNELIAELARRRPATVRIVDQAGWLLASGDDARLRPDGVHLSPEGAVEVMDRFLGDQLTRAAA